MTPGEREVGQLIDQRDYWETKATKLAEAVGELLGRDVGEHSSANCPVDNAMDFIQEERFAP